MELTKQLLTVNPYSRPNRKLSKVKAVVIHWVANSGSSAQANRNFFENRKAGKTGYGSAHYIVEGKKVVQCLPIDEMGYHVGSNVYTASCLRNLGSYPNNNTLGIEMTHPDGTGKPTAETYATTVELAAYLLKINNLTSENLWTHQQVVGWKNCHKYYVENAKEWVQFVGDVSKALTGKSVTIPTPKETDLKELEIVTNLSHGDKGSAVKTLQTNLNKLGYNCGTPDGIFGNKTDLAVEKLQKDNGLVADGIVGAKTEAKINELLKKLEAKKPKPPKAPEVKKPEPVKTTPAPSKAPSFALLKDGSIGDTVKELQNNLIKLGYSPGKVDGVYGKGVASAVSEFQRKTGLIRDGIYGQKSHDMMIKQLEIYEKENVKSVQILTGGLTLAMQNEVAAFFQHEKWWAQLQFKGDKNPRALTGGLKPEARAKFEKFLNDRNWFYEIINK